MRHIFLLFTAVCFSLNVWAQVEQEPLPDNNAAVLQLKSQNNIYGKVIDLENKKPIVAASVQLFAIQKDSVTGQVTESPIAAMLSKPNGDFKFENIKAIDSLHLVVSAVNYTVNDDHFPLKLLL